MHEDGGHSFGLAQEVTCAGDIEFDFEQAASRDRELLAAGELVAATAPLIRLQDGMPRAGRVVAAADATRKSYASRGSPRPRAGP